MINNKDVTFAEKKLKIFLQSVYLTNRGLILKSYSFFLNKICFSEENLLSLSLYYILCHNIVSVLL